MGRSQKPKKTAPRRVTPVPLKPRAAGLTAAEVRAAIPHRELRRLGSDATYRGIFARYGVPESEARAKTATDMHIVREAQRVFAHIFHVVNGSKHRKIMPEDVLLGWRLSGAQIYV